jgi:16S rRNA (guanine966-N2)-methyltransferase
MRIVAGQWRGRQLTIPKGKGIRPTLERVREAMFDVLQRDIPDARVLDLCSGSGALGFEALSRGARLVRWCDSDPRSVEAIRENARRLGIALTPTSIFAMPVLDAVWRLAKAGEDYDVVFFDPPYEGGLYDETLLALSLSGRVAPGGVVAVEHAKSMKLSPSFGHLVLDRVRQYGDTFVTYYRRPEAPSQGGGPIVHENGGPS